MSSSGPLISLVIPITRSDADTGLLLREYGASLDRAGRRYEYVFVLDGVSGAIERELRAQAREHPVKIVRLHGGGLGESIALSAGVARAAGDLIINTPQYLQIEPDDLQKVVHALEAGADFVATWRSPRVDPWLNRLQSKFFNWCLKIMMGVNFHDLNSSVRGLRRSVLEGVTVYGELYRFLPVLALRQGFRTVEVKVRHREEEGRTGFYGVGVYLRRLLDILAITFLTRFTQRPLRFFGVLGVLSMFIGLALSVEPLLGKLAGDSGARPVLVLGTVLVAFGIQLIGFGLVGEIIIFTRASHLRDYRVDEDIGGVEEVFQIGGPAPAPPAEPEVPPPEPAEPAVAAVPASPEKEADLPIRVRELVPGEDSRWDSFVRHHSSGSFYHLAGWARVVEETFNHMPLPLVAERGRQWVGVLPMFWVKSPFLGRNMISTPYGVYGGVIADEDPVRDALLDTAAEHGRKLGAGYVELRHVERQYPRLPSSDLYVTFIKELPDDPERILMDIPKKARAEVRRARDRHKLTFEEFGDVRLFFELFSQNKRHLGSPALPRRWFEALLQEFGSRAVMHVVRNPEGVELAAVMSFCFNDTVCAYYSGSRHDHHRTGVNDFIYYNIMAWSAQHGYRYYDFGRSRRDTGSAAFKRHMGFKETPLHYEYVLLQESAKLPNFHPSNPKLRVPRRIWSMLPPTVANGLGGRLSRYLP